MENLKKIYEAISAIVYKQIHISKITKRSERLLRIEKKLDFLSQQLDNLDFDSLTKPLREFVQIQVLKNNMDLKTADQFKNELPGLISAIEQKLEIQFLQFESLLYIYNALPNLKLLPATRGWAGSPDFLAKITEVILKEKPRFVLEASSGVSTIIIGLALKLNDYGKAISLEHDSLYTAITKENIDVNGIGDVSNVKHCPLRDYNSLEQTGKWYETDNLNLTERIDILIIDGPPKSTQFLARYPAVPLLHHYFSNRALILLDDANRNDEVITVQEWIKFLENNNFKVAVSEFNNFEKGMVILEVCRLMTKH